MSFFASDNLGYFDTVQVFFTETTGRAALLSGRDLELLERWRQQGASARAICKGIQDAAQKMPPGDPPRSIYACKSHIEPYVDRARGRSVGRGDEAGAERDRDAEATDEPEPADGLLQRALENIERGGRKCDSETRTELYRNAWKEVRRLHREDDGEAGSLDGDAFERLAAVEEALVDNYFETLERAERDDIHRRIVSEHENLLENMTDEARRQHLTARLRRLLIDEYGLIPLLE